MAEFFRNDQWVVDEDGLSSCKPGAPYEYHVEKSRLLHLRPHGTGYLYEWPLQLGMKTWVSLDAFEPAFLAAVKAHAASQERDFDPELFAASMELARQKKARSQSGGDPWKD